MATRKAQALMILALLAGSAAWFSLPGGLWRAGDDDPRTLAIALAVVAVACAVGPIRRRLAAWIDALRAASRRARARTAALVALAAGGYLLLTALQQGRRFYPKYHDEFMVLLQTRMLAQGRLWMPPHPLADFFDTFYVLVQPVYTSLTWPGAALMYVPSIWLGLPHWIIPLLLAGASAGLLYAIVAELFDGFAGLLACLLLLANAVFRAQSILAQAQAPILLLALLGAWIWLRWRRSGRPHAWAVALGACAGWAAITRPVDAICIFAPIGIAMIFDLRGKPMNRWVTTMALMVVAAAPFLALQVVFNVGVTGKTTDTPFALYNRRDQPLLAFGFPKFDPNLPLTTRVPQKRIMYRDVVLPAAAAHRLERLPRTLLVRTVLTFTATLPAGILMVLVPVGLLHLRARRVAVVCGVLPMFVILYGFYTLFLEHYTLLALPAVIVLIVCALRRIGDIWGRSAEVVASVAVAGLCAASLPQFKPGWRDESTPTLHFVHHELTRRVMPPAVVLFQFGPGVSYHEEPVYNIDVAWPDDAPIIRAHSLAVEPRSLRDAVEQNAEIIRYYAQRDPQRTFYFFHRPTGELDALGSARDLAAQLPPGATRPSREN